MRGAGGGFLGFGLPWVSESSFKLFTYEIKSVASASSFVNFVLAARLLSPFWLFKNPKGRLCFKYGFTLKP